MAASETTQGVNTAAPIESAAAQISHGRAAWIAANQVRPFKSVSDPSAQCFPVFLSNGLVGISSK